MCSSIFSGGSQLQAVGCLRWLKMWRRRVGVRCFLWLTFGMAWSMAQWTHTPGDRPGQGGGPGGQPNPPTSPDADKWPTTPGGKGGGTTTDPNPPPGGKSVPYGYGDGPPWDTKGDWVKFTLFKFKQCRSAAMRLSHRQHFCFEPRPWFILLMSCILALEPLLTLALSLSLPLTRRLAPWGKNSRVTGLG